MQPSFKHLIGITYEEADCYELVKRFYKDVLGITLRNYQVDDTLDRKNTNKIIDSERGNFERVEQKDIKFGDIILISIRGIESHIGVYVGDNRMLHSSIEPGSVIEPLARWERHITGYYRLWEK